MLVLRSISDDDLCSECKLCRYNPGNDSGCKINWPATFDENGYAASCPEFLKIEEWGDNITIE